MRNIFKGNDFLAFKDFNKEQIEFLTDLSLLFKKKWVIREPHDYFKGHVWGAIFEKNSTRTRNALERAAADLGIKIVYLRSDEMQMSRGEPLKDTARILDRYFDGLFIRTFGHEIVEELSDYMKTPVVNGLTNESHPTQGIADLMTIKEKKGTFENLKICHVGNIYNVAYTTMMLSATLGIDCYLACPKDVKPNQEIYDEVLKRAEVTGAKIIFTDDFEEAITDADIVYGNALYSMGQSDEEIKHLKEAFKPFLVDAKAMSKAKSDAIYMHCLPAHRGEEVTDEVIESPQSVVFDQGENRMHSIKAILASVAQ